MIVRKKTTNRLFNTFMCIASGLLLTLAFPKTGLWQLSWIAWIPLFFALKDQHWKSAFRLGLIAGLSHYLTLIYWVAYTMKTYGHLPWVLCVAVLLLFSFYLALYFALFASLLVVVARKPGYVVITAPPLWVSMEYLRSFLLSGFPWEFMGASLYKQLHLIQISDILGVYGLTFLILLANATGFIIILYLTRKGWQGDAVVKKNITAAAGVLIFTFIVVWAYGLWRTENIDRLALASPKAQIAVVQGNIPQGQKWDPAFKVNTLKKYLNLSNSALPEKPDLIVWPETAAPFYFLYHKGLTDMLVKGVKDNGAHFLVGSPSFVREKGQTHFFNSAFLIDSQGKITGKYHKAHLVPFGEYVPFRKWFPFLGKMVAQVGDFTAGEKGKTISWKGFPLGCQICYEIIFPRLSRAMTRNNAALLINMTNDAWYGHTSAPHQHFSMTVFRAVENRRTLIRSANTGISGVIDPTGRIIAETPLFQDAVITREVPLLREKTFYTRYGDIFAIACMGIVVLCGLTGFIRRK
jgi:apolipoprotein N-acyltransferase